MSGFRESRRGNYLGWRGLLQWKVTWLIASAYAARSLSSSLLWCCGNGATAGLLVYWRISTPFNFSPSWSDVIMARNDPTGSPAHMKTTLRTNVCLLVSQIIRLNNSLFFWWLSRADVSHFVSKWDQSMFMRSFRWTQLSSLRPTAGLTHFSVVAVAEKVYYQPRIF